MSAQLVLDRIHVNYPLLSPRDHNLKRLMVNKVRRKFDHARTINALVDISLRLVEGDRLALVGDNGAGKSTILRVMAGKLSPKSGYVGTCGTVLALLGGTSAGLELECTGRENVHLIGVRLGYTQKLMQGLLEEIIDFSELEDRIDDPIYSYSSGMAARLRFSLLTSLRPDILLLDEGLGATDAKFTSKAEKRLKEFTSAAGIVVLATHMTGFAENLCPKTLWLQEGRALRLGATKEVLDDYNRVSSERRHSIS